MTEKSLLYIDDSYLTEFEAEVIRSGPKFIVLNQTAFYPEGGGQPSDTGEIYVGDESFKVIKVMKRGNDVFHYLNGDIEVGTRVFGKIDWGQRFNFMRLHSGEHLLTGLFEQAGSGPKVFSSFSQLNFKPSELDENIVNQVAEEFDQIIDDDIPIEIFYMNRDQLKVGEDTRKLSFLDNIPRSVKKLRMVRIGEYALTFCMGAHVKKTSEIGKLSSLRLASKKKRLKIVYFELEQ